MPSKLKGLGLLFTTEISSSAITRYAQLMEEVKMTELWLGEAFLSGNRHFRSYAPVITQVLLSTKRLKVGIGVTSPYIRHPALLAAEWATVNEISGGRFKLGLGTMHQSLERMGDDSERVRSISRFRQTIGLIKALGSGRPVETSFPEIPYTYRHATLGFQPYYDSVPIYLGVQNPKMLKLAGEMADGLIITTGESNLPPYVKYVIQTVKEAARASGRDPASLEYIAYPVVSIAETVEEAERKVIEHVCSRTSREHPATFMVHTNTTEAETADIKALYRQGRLKEAESETAKNKKLIRIFSVSGTAADCVQRLLELAEAGVDKAFVLLPTRTDVEADITKIAKEVLPHVVEA
jgi:5,10-methylenetetrahydromethanopterin reductase